MYRCDPALNTACKKTLCRSECLLTTNKEYRADYLNWINKDIWWTWYENPDDPDLPEDGEEILCIGEREKVAFCTVKYLEMIGPWCHTPSDFGEIVAYARISKRCGYDSLDESNG